MRNNQQEFNSLQIIFKKNGENMRKIKLSLILFLAIVSCSLAQQKSFMSYYEMRDFYQASPGAFKFGLYGYQNPAITSYLHDADVLLSLSDNGNSFGNFDRWGIFTGSPNSGFGLIHDTRDGKSVTDYRLSFAIGSRVFSLGLGYGFTGGDKSAFDRSNIIITGALYRPIPQLSLGLTQTWAIDNNDGETVAEIAVRPIGTLPISLFADMAIFDDQNLKNARWSVGASLELLDGIRVNGRYYEDKRFSAGLDISFGTYGLSSNSQFDTEQKNDFNMISYRAGAIDRTIFDNLVPTKQFLTLDLKGDLKYQRYQWFDDGRTLFGLLQKLDRIKKDDNVEGLVINISGMNINMEMLWEIREKLTELKQAGKKIIIFADNMQINQYHFASVADEIVLDEFGTISIEGYSMARSYYKKMFDKINVGFEEIRLFKYKSAAESFSREEMSEGDREQRQALVDGWYDISKNEIMTSRGFNSETFDNLVNNNIIYTYKNAKENNLVDRQGRWTNLKDIMKDIEGSKVSLKSFDSYETKPKPFDDRWSKPQNQIAIVYAIGECAMESGIKARQLSKDLEAVMKDNSIAAVVLRIDSPGGDAMASDYIADILRKYKGKKPIIISQGMLAASGGYWLSMDGDKIVAAPMTITGSIGVISGMIYDKGLAEDLGITTSLVKKGEHSDLGQTWQLPLIGLGLPSRNYTAEELKQVKSAISDMYDDFVSKVASGRKMDVDKVREIAQGRVWTGIAGSKIGLVDKIGGLWTAIELAKEAAGIKKDDDCAFSSYPEPELFDFSSFAGGMLNLQTIDIGKDMKTILFRAKYNGIPMPILEMDYMEYTVEPDFK